MPVSKMPASVKMGGLSYSVGNVSLDGRKSGFSYEAYRHGLLSKIEA